MNDEGFRDKIKTSIKTENLRKYLLDCLKAEHALNALNNFSILIEKATQRFKNKIKGCQQIEVDLADNLIPNSAPYILLPKLDTLRLKLAILYAEKLGNEISEAKSSYKEIK